MTTAKTRGRAKKVEESTESAEKIIQEVVEKENVKEKEIKKQRDLNEQIKVINITNSKLTYVSRNQVGYQVDWHEYLEENWIEYKELVNMRNSQRAFFEEPWIICDWDVLKDLKVDQYYKNIIDINNLDSVFEKSNNELRETLKIVPVGIKQLIIDRAYELKKSGELDSLSTIKVIEEVLKVDLN